MKRILALTASLLMSVYLFGFAAAAEAPQQQNAQSEGYKVYPFSLYTNPNSSVSLKMTPDGGYTISKNPGNSCSLSSKWL